MDFSQVADITIPEGDVIQIAQGATVLWEKSGWPAGYIKVEYLQSTGMQYINTNVKASNLINIDILTDRIVPPANGTLWVPFGSINDSTNGQYRIFESTNAGGTKYFAFLYGKVSSSATVAGVTTSLNRSRITVESGVCKYDNGAITVTSPQASQTFSTQNSIFLFRTTDSATFAPVKIYSAKFYGNGTLIADLQPCVRLSDGKPGMYDLVRRQFLTNAGPDEFLIGPTSQIPDTYQPVYYLEGTGTQYIDTGFAPNQDSGIYQTGDGTQWYVLCRTDRDVGQFGGLLASVGTGDALRSDYGAQVISATVAQSQPFMSGVITLRKDKNVCRFYSSVNTFTLTNSAQTFQCQKNIYLFASNIAPIVYRSGKLYNSMIWDNGTLARYFVPCYRKSDSVAGMYDIVNDVFYTNSGTGEFVAGPPLLPDEYQPVEYIEGTGEQYININTPYKIRYSTKVVFQATRNQLALPQYICGCKNSNGGARNQLAITVDDNNNYCVTYVNNGSSVPNVVANVDPFLKHEYFIINRATNGFFVDGINYGTVATYSSTINYLIFNSSNGASGMSNFSSGKLYSFVWRNELDNQVINLVPCYRKSDNIAGMYDIVHDVFYTNSGTGEFIAGPDIT